MPLILQEKKDKFSFAIWQRTEDLSFFLDRIELYPEEKEEIESLKGKRLLEWIVSRYLLFLIENNKIRSNCKKDKYGKPFLENSTKYISLSHSGNYIAACISNFKIGIDIQVVSDKINRIKNKFLSDIELKICDNEFICLNRFWTAKEALYKAYGLKGLNFIDNIFVARFTDGMKELESVGSVLKNDMKENYNLYSRNIGESIMTIAIENEKQ